MKNHPAFPQHPEQEIDSGLTIRQYIAIRAMEAIISSSEEVVFAGIYHRLGRANPQVKEEELFAEATAKAACAYADALIEELDQSQPEKIEVITWPLKGMENADTTND